MNVYRKPGTNKWDTPKEIIISQPTNENKTLTLKPIINESEWTTYVTFWGKNVKLKIKNIDLDN